jgi:hypothetical protein
MSDVSHLIHDVPGPTRGQIGPPKVAADDAVDVLNDDVTIDVPPARPSGTIRVKLVPAGRSTPIPADDPWAG